MRSNLAIIAALTLAACTAAHPSTYDSADAGFGADVGSGSALADGSGCGVELDNRPDAQCLTSAECPMDSACRAGVCEPYVECDTDCDCATGEVCAQASDTLEIGAPTFCTQAVGCGEAWAVACDGGRGYCYSLDAEGNADATGAPCPPLDDWR